MNDPEPRRQSNNHFAVTADGRQYQPAGAFDFDMHDRWVAAGHCPVVSVTKAWCGRSRHADGDHSSPGNAGRGSQHWTQ